MGVRRAVEMVLDASNTSQEPICTYGPLIHNPQVLHLLEEKGISAIDDIPEKGCGTVLIRAHGVPPETKTQLKNAGFNVIDATCPRVIKVQTIIRKHAEKGYAVIIVGDNDHPEVVGLLGFSGKNGHVVSSIDDLEAIEPFEKAIVVAQTTQNTSFFKRVHDWVTVRYPHYKIFNTICDSTGKRQDEVKSIAKAVDAFIVVGGYNSGNTQRLAEIARQTGKPAFHIQSETDLRPDACSTAKTIGITAGASTPNWVIKKVYRKIETLPLKKGNMWLKYLFAAQRFLLHTNIYAALGAASLAYACTRVQQIEHLILNTLIAFLYVLSMLTFNNLTGRKADLYNDPDRAAFYEDNKYILILFAGISNICGLLAAYAIGTIPFLIIFAMSVMGMLYNLQLIPQFMRIGHGNYRKIKDIPGSKTVLIALAWGIVTAAFPVFSTDSPLSVTCVLVFLWAVGMAFVRTSFFDIFDMQGDRIVGKETIPILLGEKRMKRLMRIVLIVLAVMVFLSGVLVNVPILGGILSTISLMMFIVMFAHEQGYMIPGIKLEFLMETHFIIAGALAYSWNVFR